MEYLSGGDLRQAVLEDRLSKEERLRVILSAGEALAFAHEHDVVHRDVKPGNVLLDVSGQARLTDFDLVRAGPGYDGRHGRVPMWREIQAGSFRMGAPRVKATPTNIHNMR